MTKYREILRLSSLGLSQQSIADSCGVSKKTVMQLCFGLKLTYDEAVALMAAADCAFNRSSIEDLVVMYFLKNRIYDTYEVNAELYERNQPLLFSGSAAYYN